jgi:hypothetical protein
MKLAAITMVYNEARSLPLWLRHYGTQCGYENCFVVDHGSDDGSTDLLPSTVNRIRIPRRTQDNPVRTRSITNLANSLLAWYDYVIYTDCDELLVADPRRYSSIRDFCELKRPLYATALGINIIHKPDMEDDLVENRSISEQRSFGMYNSPMNKPSLTGIPVTWGIGFHHRERPAVFGDLFLFHLRYADVERGLERLGITRSLSWASEKQGTHQRVQDHEWLGKLQRWQNLPVVEDDPWSFDSGLIPGYISNFVENCYIPERAKIYASRSITFGKEILRIPNFFRGKF